MVGSWFDHFEFNTIKYFTTTGGLGNDDSMARMSYYSIQYFPTCLFSGVVSFIGGSGEVATGEPFRRLVESRLADPTHFKITIHAIDFEYSPTTGLIDLDVEVMEDVPDISSLVLRMSVVEDGLRYGGEWYEDVNRDMLDDVPITVDGLGELQHVNVEFAVDAAWNPADLRIVVFIQDDSDRSVLTSTSTLPTPDYAMRYYALGSRLGITSPYTTHGYDWLRIYNTGNLTDTFVASVEVDGSVEAMGVLCDAQVCYGPSFSTSLDPGEYVDLYVDVTPLGSGYAHATVTLTQDGQPGRERHLTYVCGTDEANILLVDDDAPDPYETYYAEALDHLGHHYVVWPRGAALLTASELAQFSYVIWHAGDTMPTLDAHDQAAMSTYLDGGGKLFVSGQDIALELDEYGVAPQWLANTLHAIYDEDDVNDYDLRSVQNDPISHDLDLVIQGGDGANNQTSPDAILPADGSASVIWSYGPTYHAAIKADTGTYRVVYFGFGLEGINNAEDRWMVMHRVLRWLQNGGATVDVNDASPTLRADLRAHPNPVSDQARVRFTLPASGQVTLSVFAPDGRVVRSLASGAWEAGVHEVRWDRTGDHGQRIPAGVYYYRLETNGEVQVRKTVLVR